MLKRLTLALVAAPFGAALFANPIDVYSPELLAKVSGTAFVNTGNVERILLRGDAALSHHNPVWAAATTNSYLWGTFGAFRTENDWSSRNHFYLFPEARLYPFAMHWLETSYRRRINLRNQVGAGATWAIISAPQTILKFSLMLSGEATDYGAEANLPDGTPQSTARPLMRGTPRLYFRQNLGSENTALISELWYQQALQTQNDYRWHWETGIEWALGKTLSLKTLIVYHHESAVPQRVVRDDIAFTFGASAKFAAEKNQTRGDTK